MVHGGKLLYSVCCPRSPSGQEDCINMPWKSRWQVDIPSCSLPTFLLKSPAANLSKKPILIDAGHPSYALSLASLRLWSQRLAAGLHQHGFAPQDRLLLCSGNSILFPVVLMGTIMAGGIFTGANPACTTRELAYQIKDSGAKIVLATAGSLNTVLEAAEQCGLGGQCVFVIDDGHETLEDKGKSVGTVRHWSDLFVSQPLAIGFAWPELSHEEQRDTTAVLNYSSGTTGFAKGVQITHRNYIANCIQANYLSLLGENIEAKIARTRHLSVLPMYHAYGQTTFCVNAVALGTPVFIMWKYDFITMLTYIHKFRITRLTLVPPILLAFTKRSETREFDLSSVEAVKCSAAPLGIESKKEFETLWPPGKMNCKQGWGMTEVTSSACGLVSDAIADDATVGELNPNLEAMIVDDDGREVQIGVRGEFWIRGPNVMKGYWNKPDQTAETISKDGWLMTGDIAYRNREGRIYIVDRKKVS
jgi:4-coumarate--CoA ligase